MKVEQWLHERKQARARTLAILVDPDKFDPERHLPALISLQATGRSLMVLVGGSLLLSDRFSSCIQLLKKHLEVPVVIFPGSPSQIDSEADGILLLSLISGRNADLLIGRHVEAAPALKRSGLEVLPTGYLLVDGGSPTTASYVSGTLPIPRNKPEIASATAMAGEMLGLRLMYLDGGSGASGVVPPDVIGAVTESVEVPIFVGGGIRSADDIDAAHDAGADVVVVGTAFEESPEQWVAEMVARTGVSR